MNISPTKLTYWQKNGYPFQFVADVYNLPHGLRSFDIGFDNVVWSDGSGWVYAFTDMLEDLEMCYVGETGKPLTWRNTHDFNKGRIAAGSQSRLSEYAKSRCDLKYTEVRVKVSLQEKIKQGRIKIFGYHTSKHKSDEKFLIASIKKVPNNILINK
jgi:hypothetical protein